MAPSDISLGRVTHNPHSSLRPTIPVASHTAPATAAPANAAPSFSAVFASIASAAAAAGTTVASTAPAPGSATAVALTTPANASTDPAATGGSPFGANPWLTDPTGNGLGSATNYNPIYFATEQTAQTVAQMTGGTVVSENEITSAPGSPFQQNQPNLMVQLPDGGLINPGLVADIYTHGWNQAFENQQVANEVAGAVPAGTTT